jgi:hypothetical protein
MHRRRGLEDVYGCLVVDGMLSMKKGKEITEDFSETPLQKRDGEGAGFFCRSLAIGCAETLHFPVTEIPCGAPEQVYTFALGRRRDLPDAPNFVYVPFSDAVAENLRSVVAN